VISPVLAFSGGEGQSDAAKRMMRKAILGNIGGLPNGLTNRLYHRSLLEGAYKRKSPAEAGLLIINGKG
jgi:hypothetical protein